MSKYYTRESDGSVTFHDIDLNCELARRHIDEGNDRADLIQMVVDKLEEDEFVSLLDSVEQTEKNCQKCAGDRVLEVSGRCTDMCTIIAPTGDEYTGYVPSIGLGGDGDYLSFRYCLDCGQIQGQFPVSKTTVE